MSADYFSDLQVICVGRILQVVSPVNEPYSYDCYSLEFIRSGSVILQQDGRDNILRGPVLTWMHPNVSFRYIKDERDLEFYDHFWIDIAGERARRIVEYLSGKFPAGMMPVSRPAETAKIFINMYNCFRNTPDDTGVIAVLLENLMYSLQSDHSALLYHAPLDMKIRELANDIALNPFHPVDITAAAASMFISLSHLRKLFLKVAGMPVNEYIRSQQMFYAAELLDSGHLTIKEVSGICGCSFSGFTHRFKRYIGVSPTNWMNLKGKTLDKIRSLRPGRRQMPDPLLRKSVGQGWSER